MTILHTMKCQVQARDLNFSEVMQLACSLLEVCETWRVSFYTGRTFNAEVAILGSPKQYLSFSVLPRNPENISEEMQN